MFQLIYLSAARPELTPQTFGEIMEVSHRRNRTSGVTGVAILHQGVVMQLLEGPEDAVRATYTRIAHDHRHGAVRVMLTRQARTRSFPDHDMLFRMTDSDDEASATLTLNLLRARHAARMRALGQVN